MTRYPKSGKGSKWTIKELEAIKSIWKGDTISDGEGLCGEVRVNEKVSIHFRYQFKWGGKSAWFYCGTYPVSDMSAIRKERDKAKELVKSGIDPRTNKKAEKIEAYAAVEKIIEQIEIKKSEAITFSELCAVWLKDGVNRKDGNKHITQLLNKNVISHIGSVEIKKLTENHLRTMYRSIIETGKITTAVAMSKTVRQILRWAEKRKPYRALMSDGNPTDLVDINKLLPDDYSEQRTRVLSNDEIRMLKSIFDKSEQDYATATNKRIVSHGLKKETQIAVWLCLGTLCRIGELLMTEWKDVDLDKRFWTIPARNTKGQRGKRQMQVVYLSDFTLSQFQRLKNISGNSQWAFPSRNKDDGHVCLKSVSKQIGDRQTQFKKKTKALTKRVQDNSLVIGTVEWTPHDLRRTGSTLMRKKLKISRDVINLCLNHVIGTRIDGHYIHDDYADEKRAAWKMWGNEIERILSSEAISIDSIE